MCAAPSVNEGAREQVQYKVPRTIAAYASEPPCLASFLNPNHLSGNHLQYKDVCLLLLELNALFIHPSQLSCPIQNLVHNGCHFSSMLTYFQRCLFALILFTLALVTWGVTARPLPILEQTSVGGTASSPSSQSTAPLALSPETANMPATGSSVLPSPRVEDTAVPVAENIQETSKAITTAEVTEQNNPAGPVVQSIATAATADENPPEVIENPPTPQDNKIAAVVEDKEETTTPEGPKPQAADSATVIPAKSPQSVETLVSEPIKQEKEHESVVPENKEDPVAATSTPDAEKAEPPTPEKTETDVPNPQKDVTADSSHVEEVMPHIDQAQAHNDLLPETTSAPMVENFSPAVENVTPVAENVAPVAENVAPVAENVALVVENVAPAAENVAPVVENTPVVENDTPVVENVAPAEDNVTPMVENAPVAENGTPAEEKAAPVVENVAPAEENVAPVVKNVAPVVENVAPVEKNVAPVVENTPVAENDSPVVENDAPMVENTPVAEKGIPVTEKVAPVVENVATVEENVAPPVENVTPTPSNTDAATTEEPPKKDTIPDANQGSMVDPKPKNPEPQGTEVAAPATESSPAGTEREPAAPITQSTTTDDHEDSHTHPVAKHHKDHSDVQTADLFSDIFDEKTTEPKPAAGDNSPADPLRNKILPPINDKRARHGSAPLTWNATLAHMASLRLKDQCVMPYDQERDRRGVTYAQIKNVDKATGPDISRAVDDWYNEGSSFDFSNPTRKDVYQYFVQMVWRATTQVGCATMECGDQDNSVGLFCIWDPAGNAVIENIPLKPDGTPENVDINKKIRKNVRPAERPHAPK